MSAIGLYALVAIGTSIYHVLKNVPLMLAVLPCERSWVRLPV
jgi:hypothetical protein